MKRVVLISIMITTLVEDITKHVWPTLLCQKMKTVKAWYGHAWEIQTVFKNIKMIWKKKCGYIDKILKIVKNVKMFTQVY